MILEVVAENAEQTDLLARTLGSRLKGGELIELIGDVGAGKTTFVSGLMLGLESDDHVSSPTFTISNIYRNGRLPVYHFDFYRLDGNDELIRHELAETVDQEDAVVILEWAESVQDVIDRDHMRIEVSSLGDDKRKFLIRLPASYSYMGQS